MATRTGRRAACGTFSHRPLPAGSEAAKMAAIRAVSQAARLLPEREVFMLKEVSFGSCPNSGERTKCGVVRRFPLPIGHCVRVPQASVNRTLGLLLNRAVSTIYFVNYGFAPSEIISLRSARVGGHGLSEFALAGLAFLLIPLRIRIIRPSCSVV